MEFQISKTSTTDRTARTLLSYAVVATFSLLALFLISRFNFLLFHTIAELFSVAVAWAAFVVAWNSRERLERGYLLVLGVALLFVGLVDLLHTVAYKGMGVFAGDHANLPTQLWIAGRVLKAASLLLAGTFLHRRARPRSLLLGFALATALLLAAVFLGYFPDCYVEGRGLTPFKVGSEYAICALTLLSGAVFYRGRANLDPVLLRLLLGSIALSVIQELFFTFYVDVYGLSNLLGHFAKIGAYLLIYLGVVRTGVAEPQRLLYRTLRQSRERLARSEANMNEAQRVSGVGSWEWRADTGELFWSEQTYLLFGQHPRRFRPSAQSLRETLGLTAWGAYMRNLVRCLRADDVCEFITPVRLPGSDELRHMEVSCVVNRHGGRKPQRILGMVRDVTKRQRMEAMREDVERILRHDLRSPVAALAGSLRMLNAETNIPAEHRELLAAMERSARRVLALVDRSMALRKIEEGSFTPPETRVDLVRLLGQIRQESKAFCEARDLRFALHVAGASAGGAPPETRGDADLLQSMLGNLVNNALEASPEGGTVTVSVTDPESPTVSIHNRGAVPEAIRDRFFEKYATYGKASGTGLGTYSAKLIAEAHGGGVRMRTSEENGTTVTVTLPGVSS